MASGGSHYWSLIHQSTVPRSSGKSGYSVDTGWIIVSVLSSPGHQPPHHHHHHQVIAADLALLSIIDSSFTESLPSGPLLTLLPQRGNRGCESPQSPLMRTRSPAPMTETMPCRPCTVDVYCPRTRSAPGFCSVPLAHVYVTHVGGRSSILASSSSAPLSQQQRVTAIRLLPLFQVPPSSVCGLQRPAAGSMPGQSPSQEPQPAMRDARP